MQLPFTSNEYLAEYIDYLTAKKHWVLNYMFNMEFGGNSDKKKQAFVDSCIVDDAIAACKFYDVLLGDANPITKVTLLRLLDKAKRIITTYENIPQDDLITASRMAQKIWFEDLFEGLTSGNTVTLTHQPIWSEAFIATRNGLSQAKDNDFTANATTITATPDFAVSEGGDGVGESFYLGYYYYG